MSSSKWFYTNNGSSRPRATMNELVDLFRSGTITEKTYVWHKRYCQTWTQIMGVDQIMVHIRQSYKHSAHSADPSLLPPAPSRSHGAAQVKQRNLPSIIRSSGSASSTNKHVLSPHALPNLPMKNECARSRTADSNPSPKQLQSTSSDTRHSNNHYSNNNISSNDTSEINEIVADDVEFGAITESDDELEKRKVNVVPHIIDDAPTPSSSTSKVQGYRSSGSLQEQYAVSSSPMNQNVNPNQNHMNSTSMKKKHGDGPHGHRVNPHHDVSAHHGAHRKPRRRQHHHRSDRSYKSSKRRRAASGAECKYSLNQLVAVDDPQSVGRCYGLVVDLGHNTVCIKFNQPPYESQFYRLHDCRCVWYVITDGNSMRGLRESCSAYRSSY